MKPLFWPLLAAMAGLLGCAGEPPAATSLTGYGEAHYVYASARDAGRINELLVAEGDVVTAGQAMFSLETGRDADAADAARLSAEAAAARANQALGDAIARAQAEAALANQTLTRTRTLFERGLIARARLDADQAAVNAAQAALAQARAEQSAARRDAAAATAQARGAGRRLSEAAVSAPAAGRVERVYRRPGEVVAPGEPVLSILAPENMRVRFFAPQSQLSRLSPGATVAISCDGCPQGLTGKVTYVATEPQFTPPVIYSAENRDRLVFQVEASVSDPLAIRPGQPLQVRPS